MPSQLLDIIGKSILQNLKNIVPSWAQFHGSAYHKHRIDAYGSREFCAYGKRISRVSGEFWLLRVRTSRF